MHKTILDQPILNFDNELGVVFSINNFKVVQINYFLKSSIFSEDLASNVQVCS